MNVTLEMQQKEENPKVDCFCDSLVTAVTQSPSQSAPTILVLKTLVDFVVVPFIFRIFVRYETFVTLK